MSFSGSYSPLPGKIVNVGPSYSNRRGLFLRRLFLNKQTSKNTTFILNEFLSYMVQINFILDSLSYKAIIKLCVV
jgi:hypothetical protein